MLRYQGSEISILLATYVNFVLPVIFRRLDIETRLCAQTLRASAERNPNRSDKAGS